MPTHDIIDNHTEKLVDHLNQILGTSERARFAVGYLILSGLTSVAKRLLVLQEFRLPITPRPTLAPQRRQVEWSSGNRRGGGAPHLVAWAAAAGTRAWDRAPCRRIHTFGAASGDFV
jgi:hypothetical protein